MLTGDIAASTRVTVQGTPPVTDVRNTTSSPHWRMWLEALEDDNTKLKKLPPEAMLDNAALKQIASKR